MKPRFHRFLSEQSEWCGLPVLSSFFRSKGGGGGTAPAGSSSLASLGKPDHYVEDHFSHHNFENKNTPGNPLLIAHTPQS